MFRSPIARSRSQPRSLRRPSVRASLRRDTSAAMAVEYAIVFPFFLALILACLHTALVFFAQQGLETAAETAARLVLTGQAQQNYTGSQTQTSQQQFKAAACAALPPFLMCNRLYVDVSTVSNYSSAVVSPPTFNYNSGGTVTTGFNYTPGAQGSIVVLRLMYLWPTLTGPAGFSLVNTANSNRLLIATSVMKTEGY
jgi:Flp pilus assembly protein TadG